MSKIFKTLIILFIILFSATTLVLATDINMNLENPSQTDTNSEETNVTDTNNPDNTNDLNSVTDTNTIADENFEQDNIGGPVAPSGVSSITQENMSFSNVLNILVITVGVILILLAIAIIIRLKN